MSGLQSQLDGGPVVASMKGAKTGFHAEPGF